MAKVETIGFLEGNIPQYPECSYALIDNTKHWMTRGEWIPVVFCKHPDTKNLLCCTNHRGNCPAEK